MAKRLRIRRGNFADLPTLSAGEFGFAEDTANLYIGQTSGTNKLLATLDISSLSEVDAIASGDKIPVYDVSTSTNKYVEAGDLTASLLKKYVARFDLVYIQDYTFENINILQNDFGTVDLSNRDATNGATIRISNALFLATKTKITISGGNRPNEVIFQFTPIYGSGYVDFSYINYDGVTIDSALHSDGSTFEVEITVYP